MTDRNGNYVNVARTGGTTGDITEVAGYPNSRYVLFYYQDSANPHQITQAVDGTRSVSYTYDSLHRLTSFTDANGKTTSFTYKSGSQLGDLASATDPLGNVGNVSYDSSFRLSSLSGQLGAYSYAYTSSSGVITACDITDPNGFVRHLTYTWGYVGSDERAVGKPEQQLTSYNRQPGSKHILNAVDQLNRTTSYTYDSVGNVTSVTRQGSTSDVTTSFTYDPVFSRLTSVTDPLNHTWSAIVDGFGNVASLTDAANNKTTATYNQFGEVTSITDAITPNGNTTHYTYTSRGDPATVVDPLGNTTSFTTDALGRVTRVVDPLGNATQFAYDGRSHVTTVTDAKGGTTTYQYDGLGDLKTVTDANHHSTQISYNFTAGTVQACDAVNHCQTSTVNGLGNVVNSVDGRGASSSFGYDGLGRLAGASFTAGIYSSSFGYTYDGGNRLTQIWNNSQSPPTVTHTFAYDLLDNLTSATSPEGTVTYTYDAARRRATMKAGSQATVNYTFDADNRITALSSGPLSASVAYDQDSRRTSLTQPNGLIVTYGYDAASNLTSLIDKVNGNTIGYAYYTYDANGRRVGGSGNLGLADINLPAAASVTYAANNTLSTWNGTAAATDGANNLTGDPTNDFAYFFDERNHLAQVSHLSITQSWMTYDGLGRREQLGNNVGSLSWTNYLYDGITPVQEQSSSGSKVDSLTMPGSGEVLARTDSSGTVAPIYDGTGSTVWLVNSAGAIATQYTYEAYGKPTPALAASSNPFQFTGREHDPSGLYFMRNRYYSPTLSRFVSSDPIGFGGGDANLFRYAGGDPVNSSDPLGTFYVDAGGGIGIGFFGPSDFALGGISFDLGPLLANLGLIFARNGAGLTGGGGLSGDRASLGEGGPPEDTFFGPGLLQVQLGGPNAQIRKAPPPAVESPDSKFWNCIVDKLFSGDTLFIAPGCIALSGGCLYYKDKFLCTTGLATCGLAWGIWRYCGAKARGENPPPLPPYTAPGPGSPNPVSPGP